MWALHLTVRKCRSVQELSRWKATEFRLFLLYIIGPIVLKNIINEECYTNFYGIKYFNDNPFKL